ncbi:MAG: hypothetical protein LBU70_04545 [Chitinispirillales bacterium]|jgi:ferredoxin|nr:hypothetical protein [Chitinispirillales bacterium]
MSLISYKPFWPETAVLLGAGAMASLGVPTTIQMGKTIRKLAESEGDKSVEERINEVSRFYGIETELGHFLTTLGDSLEKDGASFSKESIEIAKKILPEGLSEEKITAMILQWKAHYDWNALRRLAIKIPIENENYIIDLYNIIDGSLVNNHGVQVQDAASGEPVFLYSHRLRAARNLLVLLSNLMIACAYHKTRIENPKDFEPYLEFIKTLGELMHREAIDLEVLEYGRRIFYMMSFSTISFNFDPIFMWFRFVLNSVLNKNPPYLGKRNVQVRLHHDLAVFAVVKGENSPPEVYPSEGFYLTNETLSRRINRVGDCGHLYRISKYYCVHGGTCIRECENCGKMMLVLGEWTEISKDLFSPPPFKTNLFERTPYSKEEEDAYNEGQYDAVQCTFCASMTYAYNSTMVMQTAYKGGHVSFLEEIQRDAKVSLSGAKHVILLGYQLPPDDVIWRSAIVAKQNHEDVYCSVVVGYEGEDRWIEGYELVQYVKKTKENIKKEKWADYGINAIDAAMTIFDPNNVRAYTGGIPQVWCSDGNLVDKDKIKDLLYPSKVFPEGVAAMRIKDWEKYKK